VSPSWDPQFEATQQAALDFPRATFRQMPDATANWAAALLPFLDG
jgi:hypothetical protein